MVDDEPDFQTIMHAWLEPKYELLALKSWLELYGALRAKSPDLVILDLHMPEVDGFEICKKLRSTPGFEKLPVLFLTASRDTEDYRRNFEAGGTGYLVKPVGRRQLIAAVEDLLAGVHVPQRITVDAGGGD
jgi:putative two-component system response regulator